MRLGENCKVLEGSVLFANVIKILVCFKETKLTLTDDKSVEDVRGPQSRCVERWVTGAPFGVSSHSA